MLKLIFNVSRKLGTYQCLAVGIAIYLVAYQAWEWVYVPIELILLEVSILLMVILIHE